MKKNGQMTLRKNKQGRNAAIRDSSAIIPSVRQSPIPPVEVAAAKLELYKKANRVVSTLIRVRWENLALIKK